MALLQLETIDRHKLTGKDRERAETRVAALQSMAKTHKALFDYYIDLERQLRSLTAWMYWTPSLQSGRASVEASRKGQLEYLDMMKRLSDEHLEEGALQSDTAGPAAR
jgi:hypothetical protein